MHRVKSLLGIKGLLGWIIAGMISLVIVSLFVLGYNYSGTHIANPSGATDYKWKPGQYKAVWSEGINYMRMDDNGFNNLSSDINDIDLLLMGGSHMEAAQFKTEYNAGSILNESIAGIKTYNIGVSGHQLLNCMDNLESAIEEYHPSSFVVIETDNLNVDAGSIQAVLDGTLADIPSYDSGVMYQLQRIPALKVIYKQLMDKLSIDRSSVASGNAVEAIAAEGDGEKLSTQKLHIMTKMLKEKYDFCEKNGVHFVLAYTPGVSVAADGSIYRNDDEEWVSSVENAAEDIGIIVVDCFEAMKNEYERTYALPFGFDNATMGSGHLNETGHRIVAQEIAKAAEGVIGYDEEALR